MKLFTGGNDAGELRSYLNQLVIELNVVASATGILYPPGACTLFQMKTIIAAISAASLFSVVDAIPAEVENPINIQWTSAGLVQVGDNLFELIRVTLGFTTNQMTALLALARQLPA